MTSQMTKKSVIQPAKKSSKSKTDILYAILFLLPFFAVYAVFTIYPVIQGIYISFFDWTLMGRQGFVGLSNYTRFLGDKFFWEALGNTTWFAVISTPAMIVVGLGLALLANRVSPFRRFYRIAFYLPSVLSVSVISYIALYLLQPYMGFINLFLHTIEVLPSGTEIFWIKESNLAWVSILWTTVWWSVGFNMLLYISALQDIPDYLYEAASLDGATPMQQFFAITVPSLTSTTKLLVMLQIISSYKVFGQIWLITKGGPGTATRPLIQYIYQTGFVNNKLGYSAAMSYVLFVVLVLLTVIQRRITKGGES